MLKIVLFGLIAHLLFLASIFQIYFQSPVISGLSPLPNLEDPPAKRLEIIKIIGKKEMNTFFS